MNRSVTLAYLLDMGGLCKNYEDCVSCTQVCGLKSQIMLEGSSADKDLGIQGDSRVLFLYPALAKLHLERDVQSWANRRDRDILERVQIEATEMTKGSELFSHDTRL